MKHHKFTIYLSTILAALFVAAVLNVNGHYLSAFLTLAIAFGMFTIKDVRRTLERQPKQRS